MDKKHENRKNPTDSFEDDAINRRLRDDVKRRTRKGVSTWMYIGVAVLILLLLVWLSIADLWGDTDVAADMIAPLASVF